jgi:predicted DNA-binding transcriptional regulator AlpA
MQLENPFQVIMDKLNDIEAALHELRMQGKTPIEGPEADLLSITQASTLLGIAKNTIYGLSSQSKIPVIKKVKRLYFSKKELLEWLRSGRRATVDELSSAATEYHAFKRRAERHSGYRNNR